MVGRFGSTSSSGRFGGGRPWFRIGNIDVTTTVAIVGVGVLWMFVWAIEGRSHVLSQRLYLISSEFGVGSVTEGQVWRLVTWPVVNEPDIWAIILFAVFYMLGNQMENLMGRKPFLWFIALLTMVPAVMVTLFEVLMPGFEGFAFGLRFVELGILVAFAAQYPTARFWPGIPAWGLAAIIVGLDFLQALGARNDYQFTMLVFTVVVGVVGIRSFGFANELHWVPKVPLPASMTGESPSPRAARPQRRRRRSRGKGNLSSVPPPPSESPSADMEIDALLDQVADSGLDSLSKEQRRRLEDHSKRLRKRRGE